MLQINEIIEFVKEQTGAEEVYANSDIFEELHCVGDDFHELIDLFAKKYEVDISSYLWYFHADEEGQYLGGLFFKPPYSKVKRIPVIPQMLFDFAQSKKWDMVYPKHKISKYRYDILINFLVAASVILFLIYYYLIK